MFGEWSQGVDVERTEYEKLRLVERVVEFRFECTDIIEAVKVEYKTSAIVPCLEYSVRLLIENLGFLLFIEICHLSIHL